MADTLSAILDLEIQLNEALSFPDLAFFQRAERCARRIWEFDAFYICSYDALSSVLRYVYNSEDGLFDHPEAIPIGTGPTSWVIRNREPLVVRNGDFPPGVASRSFGNTTKATLTQIHCPYFSAGKPQVAAVVSVQWHQPIEVSSELLLANRWFAQRLGTLIEQREAYRQKDARQQSVESIRLAEKLASDSRWSASLAQLCKDLTAQGPEGYADANRLAIRRIRELMTAQVTDAPSLSKDQRLIEKLSGLSRREKEIMLLASQDLTNSQIADQVGLGVETVKSHISSILRKTGFSTRAEVAEALRGLF